MSTDSPSTRPLDDLLAAVWSRVRKKHLFPELPHPRIVQDAGRTGLDIHHKTIRLSAPFVEKMAAFMPPADVLEGLLDHAVSRYTGCPWSFSHHLKIVAAAKTVLGEKDMARRAAGMFMDVAAGTHCVSRMDTPLPDLLRHLEGGPLDRVVTAVCQRLWGTDLGARGHRGIAGKLSRLAYLDRTRWPETAARFATLVTPLLTDLAGTKDGGRPPALGEHGLRQYTAREVDDGLKSLAAEAGSPGAFHDLVADFQDDIQRVLEAAPGMGRGRGVASESDAFYYMKLAQSVSLPIKKAPDRQSGAVYPHHHVPWEAGGPCAHIDPWTSLGKILPGITQTWAFQDGVVLGQARRIPDCLVVIDSSDSMQHPARGLSHAVLGAACACEAYLKNGAAVAVYNFGDAASGGSRLLDFTRRRADVYRTLCLHLGGGTRVGLPAIAGLLEPRLPDVFLITDMQITNLKEFMAHIGGWKNRVTAVHIGDNPQVRQFRSAMKPHGRIRIYPVEKKEDIPRIVLGNIRDYLLPHFSS